ncbi:MAG TPA: HAD-IA family hydrolase [Gaiellaceae bacterium]
MSCNVKGLICDLDGVLRRWPADDMYALEARHRLPEGALLAAAFAPKLLRKALTGAISDREWRQFVAIRLTAEYGVAGDDAVREWGSLQASVDEPMLELVREVQAEHRVALLTNATTRLNDDLEAVGLAGEFDAVVNSAEIGFAKPDAEAFHCAAAAIGLTCAECAFVDDTEAHVEAAERVGLTAIAHRDAEQTRVALVEVGLVSCDELRAEAPARSAERSP